MKGKVLILALILASTASIADAGFLFLNKSNEVVRVFSTQTFTGRGDFIYQTEWRTVQPGEEITLDDGRFDGYKHYWLVVESPTRGIIASYDADGPNFDHSVRRARMVKGNLNGFSRWGWTEPKLNSPVIAEAMRRGDLTPLTGVLTNTTGPYDALFMKTNVGKSGGLRYTLFNNGQRRTDYW